MDRNARIKLETEEKWYDFFESMPFINLKKEYKFRVTPPVSGAIFRLRVLAPSSNEYSIYFDAHDTLGIVGKPYYELYPYHNDVYRALDINEIIEKIYEQENGQY